MLLILFPVVGFSCRKENVIHVGKMEVIGAKEAAVSGDTIFIIYNGAIDTIVLSPTNIQDYQINEDDLVLCATLETNQSLNK
jgi:hypothetical protein